MLHGLDHFEQVEEDAVRIHLVRLDADGAHSDQQLDAGDQAGSVLHGLVQVGHLAAAALLLLEVGLQVAHFVEDLHEEDVVVSGAEQ